MKLLFVSPERPVTCAAQDVAARCKELGVTALHIKVRGTGGNKSRSPGPGAQSALRALARNSMKWNTFAQAGAKVTVLPYW